jgi:hypothetical protein
LFKTLDQANRRVRLRMEVATTGKFSSLVTLGFRALHYTGHGLPGCLAFEDGSGKMHPLDADVLRRLLVAGSGAEVSDQGRLEEHLEGGGQSSNPYHAHCHLCCLN